VSRAFVDEDSGADEASDLYDIPLPLPPGAKNYMTPEGAGRMTAELRELIEVERPRAASQAAAAEGEALRRLAELDRRIAYLTRMSSLLETVGPPRSLDRVVFGLRVRVREEGGGEREYRIVGADESQPERGLLSWASPVARALIGKRPGDLVAAPLPKGEYRIRILEILAP
jgi:transcription elongation factor GreB